VTTQFHLSIYKESLGCGWRRWPPGMEGSCEYVEQAVGDSWQGTVLQLGGCMS